MPHCPMSGNECQRCPEGASPQRSAKGAGSLARIFGGLSAELLGRQQGLPLKSLQSSAGSRLTCAKRTSVCLSAACVHSWAQRSTIRALHRLDVALAVEADGLHVGETDLPWRTARRLLGFDRILGCSTYGRPELVREAPSPEVRADYLGSGAIFPTPTKPGSTAKGLEHLRPLRRLVGDVAGGRPVPVVAIGGVGLEHAAKCIEEGADGVAAVSALLRHSDADCTREAARAMSASIADALSRRAATGPA